MDKIHVLDHPLLQHKLAILRDETTGVKDFREVVSEIEFLIYLRIFSSPLSF